jgi:GMP synthase-like glutamine amidotransferase
VELKPGLILQHGELGPPARLGEWLGERGLPFVVHRAWQDPLPDVGDFSFVASLGSQLSVTAEDPAWIPAEIALLRDAVDLGVPVLGLCFGGQALSLALGGGVDVLPRPEIGWVPVEPVDGAVPAGPWLQYHHEQMRVPDGAVELARSPAGPAAFRFGPHLAVQFHPEVDAELVESWVRRDPSLAADGINPEAVIAESRVLAPVARERAFTLFDAWLSRVRDGHSG